MPAVFISYTHSDQSIARRVARRLSAYGIDAWLDERELRLGCALEPTIEAHINDCDLVVPIATAAAARSEWVAKELSFARRCNPARSICPLFVEPIQSDPLFSAHLGLNATDPCTFESKLLELASAVLGGELPDANRSRLLDDVRSAASEEPQLSILVDACLDGPGLSDTNFDTVMALPGHVLDYAINALFDGCADQCRTQVAWHAAHLFKQQGAGFYALEKYARLGNADKVLIDTAIGNKLLPARHTAALRIISSSSEPNDRALANFVSHNASSLSPESTETVVRLICYPHRKARDSTVRAALEGIKLVPTSGDLRRMWIRWIQDGQFDGIDGALTQRQAILDLGRILTIESEDWHDLTTAFSSHIRRLARTPDRKSIQIVLNYLTTAASDQSPLLPDVVQQLQAATGSAEWDGWADREEMSLYVDELVACAQGDRDWRAAIARYRESWQAVKALNAELDRDG